MSDEKEIVKSPGMSAFFTRDAANAGIVIELTLPTGEKTDQWLRVRGVDSDAYREAEAASFRSHMEVMQIKDPEAQKKARLGIDRGVLASLVSSWSFSDPCTPENVVKFFKNAPQVEKLVDQASFNRALFFKKRPDNSSGTPKPNSGSTSTHEGRDKPNAPA
jgi:hypothetical protein